ncbi:MAG TPA: TonB family protein [Thermoanaerobaculia bacterium]|nr:TonB family protein [Thermoanaerobaculia bacterium]
MNIPEEFGKYLLLKKLTEDPLGETFRAGKVGKDGMEQVVLLRVLNGKGVDGEKLWQKTSGRTNVQQMLKSPNIGSGVDLGRVRSFPYAAYDYISGKNLGTLLAQANRQLSPIPTDHALLIAERISLALAAAYETRIQEERILHGFVVPQLVMISNEGETRLLGFEVAPGLRSLASAGWQDPEVRPYLSPETFEGAAPSRADDVFSLGAILFELLTGERLPVSTPEGYAARIDAAMLPNEGTPLPDAIAGLLKKSLTTRDQRVPDAVTWHKTMSKLMIDSHYSPTTFNLAFFMHNLFRDEIEKENQEIQAEKKLELPKKAAEPAPVPAAVPAKPAVPGAGMSHETREVASVRDATLSGTRSQFAEEKSKKGMWIGLAAVLVAAAGAGAYFMLMGGKSADTVAAAATPPPIAVQASMPGPAPVPAGPSPEELQAQIQSMISAQGKEVEEKLKGQYDDRIKLLQQQLEESRRAAVEQERQAQQAARQPERTAVVPVQETPAPAPAEKPASRVEPPAPVPTPTPQPAIAEPEPEEPAPVQQAPVVRKTQFGDLVQSGPGVTAPKLTSRLDPRYPAAAQRLNKAATVDIRVLVDENGRVVETQRVGAKAGFGFDEAAIEAARRAQFNPATKDGVRVKMWYTLRVAFQPG